jgi:lysozyme family protein
MNEHARKAISATLGHEGGYVFDRDDPGGETNWGITKAVAVSTGYNKPMRDMTRDEAISIYYEYYWKRVGLDMVAGVYPRVANEMFDTGVNMGQAIPVRFLQRALNLLNNRGTAYGDIVADGRFGPASHRALRSFAELRGTRGEEVLIRILDAFQGERYATICERRELSEKYFYGWVDKRLGNA